MQSKMSAMQLAMLSSIIAQQKIYGKYLVKALARNSDLSESEILKNMEEEYQSIIKEETKHWFSDLDIDELNKRLDKL